MIECLDTGLVYSNPRPYLRSRQAFHPTLVGLDGDELLCSFDIGEGVESLDYRTYLSRSTDGGQTWQLQGPLFEDPTDRPATHTVRLRRLADSSLAGLGGRFYRDDPEEGLVNRETSGFVPMDLFLVRSADGYAWSAPEVIAPPLDSPAFEICHPILDLPDGTWLAPTATARGWNGELPAGEKAVLLISRDRGRTWPECGVTFQRPGITYWEQSVVPLADGRLLAVAWAHDSAAGANLPTPYAFSADGGRTFTPPRPTGLQGQTCKLLPLEDSCILCIYRRSDRPGLWSNLARIEGTAWKNLAEKPLWGAGLQSSGMRGKGDTYDELSALHFGYPTLLALPDGEILVAFWCLEGWTCNIRWFRLRVET